MGYKKHRGVQARGAGGGSVIDFWMRWRKLQRQDATFKETITELAKMLL